MMITQVNRHKVTDHVIPAGTEAPSRLLSNFPANAKSTSRHYVRQTPPVSGATAACAGFWSPEGEVLRGTANRSANAGAPSSIWGIPVKDALVSRIAYQELAYRAGQASLDCQHTGSHGAELHITANILDREQEDADRALSGATAFVAALSRVDGLVLMGPDLDVRGFGCEILAREPVTDLHVTRTTSAGRKNTRKGDPTAWGTRHRSMLSYCNASPGSVGFVVSQDGHVRAIASTGSRLKVWDGISLAAAL